MRKAMQALAWVVVAGVVTGIGLMTSASASTVGELDVKLDKTSVVRGGEPTDAEIIITAVIDQQPKFFGIDAVMLESGAEVPTVLTSEWESTSNGHEWRTTVRPTAAMDRGQLGVRVHYGIFDYHEITEYAAKITVMSQVDIQVTGPFLIDALDRTPIQGTIRCYSLTDDRFYPFTTRFTVLYETSPEVWKAIPGRTATDNLGRFSVSLASVELGDKTLTRLKVNVPGFGAPSTLCGWTAAQANVWEYDVKQPAKTTPSAPTSLKIAPQRQAATLSWTPGADGYSPVTAYQVKRGALSATLRPTTHAFAFTSLSRASHYTVSVRTQNAKGWSPWATTTFWTAVPAPRAYKSCRLLQKDYPGGVGIPDVKRQNYYPSARLYQMQPKRLDSDRDKIACERR